MLVSDGKPKTGDKLAAIREQRSVGGRPQIVRPRHALLPAGSYVEWFEKGRILFGYVSNKGYEWNNKHVFNFWDLLKRKNLLWKNMNCMFQTFYIFLKYVAYQ